jgi:uncharacterized membrane protein YesL
VGGIGLALQVAGRAVRDWWDDWVNLAVVNLAWGLAWLTVILGPPATLGLFYVANELAHGRSVGLRGLVEGGRRFFLAGWGWFLLNLVVGALLAANILFYASLSAGWAPYVRGAFIFIAVFWLVVQFYTPAYMVEQARPRLGLALRNSLFTTLAAPGYTFTLVVLALVLLAISLGTAALFFLGGVCLAAVLANRAVLERLETYKVREREALAAKEKPAEP